jgi:hypothetical protein
MKWVIRDHISKDRQYNDQKRKDKKINNDLQNITQTTKDWALQTPLKLEVKSEAPEGHKGGLYL